MPAGPFRFKQFSIAHDRCSHKVGTDGVLLGAWVRILPADQNILDIGTGSGLIALMIAQRTDVKCFVDAIDIGEAEACQARDNVLQSPWPDRVKVYHTSLQEFQKTKKYDLIVTNPPYFSDSLLPPDQKRGRARHSHALPYAHLVEHALLLLSAEGRLAVIMPSFEALKFISLASTSGLSVLRQTILRSRVDKAPERLLLELGLSGERVPDSELVLHSDGEKWSEPYEQLTKDFYLKI
jgi:tRNA1Val (adenine37-N6)-methyltransferase